MKGALKKSGKECKKEKKKKKKEILFEGTKKASLTSGIARPEGGEYPLHSEKKDKPQ